MYQGKSVTVVFATYKEKSSIKRVIESFYKTGFVDETIVVNNNAQVGTDIEVKKTKARIVYEPKQGYGYAFQRALNESKGYYTVVCEPDGTFTGDDLEKFLVFAKQFKVIFGSRTRLIPSLSVASMGATRKYANVLEAKTIEFLFNTGTLTDVGCAYKLFRRDALEKIKKTWKQTSPLFNTELILIVVTKKIPFVEIPVNFHKRVGKSSITHSPFQIFKWSIIIQTYILLIWFKSKFFS